ncbi:MAG: phytoene desaturase family protein [Ilumatobacteraceae bacterium]
MTRSHDFDVVVVGAGHNGLIAAAYLARSGVSTLLVEARDTVGGTASSESFAGASVNVCNCDHAAFRSTPIMEELDLASHGLRYIDLEPSQVNIDWTTGRAWTLHHELEPTLASLSQAHPDSVDDYRRYVSTLLPVAKLVLAAALSTPSRGSLVSTVIRRGGLGARSLLRISRMSAADVMRDFFSNEAVIGPAMVEGPVVWGVSPETPGTGLGALSYAMRHAVRVGRPVGGSGALIESLRDSFLSAGGMLRTSTKVTGILCEGASVAAVQMSDGTTVTAEVVIAACDPRRTFVSWLKNPPARAASLVASWKERQLQEGYESKIDAVTTMLPALRSAPGHAGASHDIGRLPGSTHVVSPSLSELHRGSLLMAEGRTMPRMALLANSPSSLDDSLAPAGRHVFSLEAIFTPYGFSAGWDDRTEPERWLSQWQDLVEPGFIDSIIDWRVHTPKSYEEQFHLPKGHATSFAGGPLSTLLGRDRELTRHTTPVTGLYLTGAATFPGAGIWGASGRNVARLVQRHIGR